MGDWYDDDKIWAGLTKADQARLTPFRDKVARLMRFGYTVTAYDPGVKFINPAMPAWREPMDFYDRQVSMDAVAWDVFDAALAKIEKLESIKG